MQCTLNKMEPWYDMIWYNISETQEILQNTSLHEVISMLYKFYNY